MNFNIRGAVLHNIKGMNEQELADMVQDSIQQGDEKLLPGLGVLFEAIWKNSEQGEKSNMMETLQQTIASGNTPPVTS